MHIKIVVGNQSINPLLPVAV